MVGLRLQNHLILKHIIFHKHIKIYSFHYYLKEYHIFSSIMKSSIMLDNFVNFSIALVVFESEHITVKTSHLKKSQSLLILVERIQTKLYSSLQML